MFSRILLILSLVLFLYSCSKDEEIYVPSEVINPYYYKDGLEAFENNDFFFCE